MEYLDSRRLTGPNLLWDHPGAVVETLFDPPVVGEAPEASEAEADWAIALWQEIGRRTLDALGWQEQQLTWRKHATGISFAFSAPIDALYSACEVADWIWQQCAARLSGKESVEQGLAPLRLAIAEEQDPKLCALATEAAQRGINFCGDDEWTTLGMGFRGRSWETTAVPAVEEVDWAGLGDIPCAMVTGTNGKSTTVRLLKEMVTAAGMIAGACSTDWIQIGDEVLDQDDWSGPGGARAVLKDPRVEVALLETARGGMLRRGLGVNRVDVGVITNVAPDHLGEMGVHDLADLTEVKFILERAAEHLVLNADDPEVRRRGKGSDRPITWYGLDPQQPLIREHLAAGGRALLLDGADLTVVVGQQRMVLAIVDEVPMTLGGAACYNIGNALAACGAALQMGLEPAAISAGLRAFRSDPESNPGRLNVFRFNGVTALVDFAHNPHGMEALLDAASRIPHRRMLVLLGQAGDRDDNSIRDLARITAAAAPDRVIIKEMTRHLRGRAAGEVAQILHQDLARAGLPSASIGLAASELEAVEEALQWAQEGDLLLLLSHAEREAVLARLREAQ